MNLNYNLNNTQVICCLSLLILVALLISCNNNNNGFMEGYTGTVGYGKINTELCKSANSPLYLDISHQYLPDVSGVPTDITTDISFQDWLNTSKQDGYIIDVNNTVKGIKFQPSPNYNIIYSCEPNPNFGLPGRAYINSIPSTTYMIKYTGTVAPGTTVTPGTTVAPGTTVVPGTSTLLNPTSITDNVSISTSTSTSTQNAPSNYIAPGTLNNNNNNNAYNQGYNQGYNQEADNNQFGNNQFGNNQFGNNTSQYPYDNDNNSLSMLNAVSRGFNNTFGQNNGNPLNLFGLMDGSSNDPSTPSNIFTTSDGRQGIANTQNTIKGIPSSQIPSGQNDLYILKSQVVPPVCPACPPVYLDKKTLGKECPPCPSCARCPEPSFDCKKVPNYELGPQNTFLPRPVLNNFSTFGR